MSACLFAPQTGMRSSTTSLDFREPFMASGQEEATQIFSGSFVAFLYVDFATQFG